MEDAEDGDPTPAPSWAVPGLSRVAQAELVGSIAVSVPVGLIASDLDGRIAWVNPVGAQMFGWAGEKLLGCPLTILLPQERHAHADCLRARIHRGESVAPFQETGVRSDGSTFDLTVTPGARRDDEGQVVGATLVLRDVSEEVDVRRRLSREAFVRGLDRESSDVTLVADAQGALTYVTPSAEQFLGHTPTQLGHVLGAASAHPDDLAATEPARRRLREAPGARERFTMRVRDLSDRWHWFAVTATNLLADPDIAGIVVNLREITAETEAQQALRDSEARYRAIAETTQQGIAAVGPDGEILFANERLAAILGLTPGQIRALGRRNVFVAGPATAPPGAAQRPNLVSGTQAPFDVTYAHPVGGSRVLSVSTSRLSSADGPLIGSLAMVSDVTEDRADQESLRRQALHDPLTGLANRLLFLERLATAGAGRQWETGHAVAVLFLDVDDFKLVNDAHGHDVGDRFLVELARRLQGAVRGSDTVARLGGDEFAVICEDADAQTATAVAGRIQELLEAPVAVGGGSVQGRVSIGIALSPPHPVEELLRRADAAMYEAKLGMTGTVVLDGP